MGKGSFMTALYKPSSETKPVPLKENTESEENRMQEWLNQKEKAELIDLIVHRCNEDDVFFEAVLMRATVAKPFTDLREIKRVIQQAYRISGFVHWRNTRTYYFKLDQVGEMLRGMLEGGQADAVIELVEYTMKRWETAIQHIDDSDGGMGMVLDELHRLHLDACRMAEPDSKKLATRLFNQCFKSKWDLFYAAYDDYAVFFGNAGKKQYQKLVETEFNKLPILCPGDDDSQGYGVSRWLSSLMIQFAKEEGDTERELEIMQRNLSGWWSFIPLIDRCEEEGWIDRAVGWVEKGLTHSPGNRDLETRRYELYWKQGRHNEALEILWTLFSTFQTLENYSRLIRRAKERSQLETWREKALAAIRAETAEKKKNKDQFYRGRADHSLLVEIFLWEGAVDAAWHEANAGGCSESLWHKLAEKREAEHPEEMIPVYLHLAECSVNHKNNDAYHAAVKTIQQAKALAEQCGTRDDFDNRLEKLRTQQKAKRNFMKYLVEAGL